MLGSTGPQPGMYQVFPSQVKKAGTRVIFTTSASVKIETASTRPNSLLIRSDVRMNAEKTVPMIRAAATMTRPIAAIPCSTAARRQAVHVLLPDAAHQEDHVVHEEPEEDRKGDGRHERLDRAGLVQAHDVEQVALLEHEREHAEPDESREDGRHGCGQRDHDRPERHREHDERPR